ncbi:MAG: GNAT family N-acetyltransferase, partial [Burkholderiaceae bacterium]
MQVNLANPARFDSPPPTHSNLVVQWANSDALVLAAKQLRYRVFHQELGAHLSGGQPGLDHDEFDNYCKHLVARDTQTGEVVGTYRLLEPSQAK